MNNKDLYQNGVKYEIFIGLKDKDTYEEVLTIEDFKRILVEVCFEKNICFSLLTQLGGYTHNKGYTTETSLRVIVIGASEEEMMLLGDKLKKQVNTDTILITKTDVDYAFI